MTDEQIIRKIADPSYSPCREDVIWTLEWIKKRVAEKDPRLLALSQPHLLENFHDFAEIAVMLIRHQGTVRDSGRLKSWIRKSLLGYDQNV